MGDTAQDSPGLRDAGRSDDAATLRARLAGAPAPYLEGALDNPALGPRELSLLLRNRNADAALLDRVARARRWTRYHEVKKALVGHPNCPLAASQTLVRHLYWKDHLDLTLDVRAHPVIRRRSEDLLAARLDELSVGGRGSIATRCPRGLIVRLSASGDARVLSRLVSNPRTVEADVVRIASRVGVPAAVLGVLAAHPHWCARREVRLALLRNRRTPAHAALGLVNRLEREDLQRVARDAKVPRIVRVGAERRLRLGGGTAAREAGGPAGRSLRGVG